MPESGKAWGLAMGLAAALIGGGWQVATRLATTSTIAPADLIVLRYGIPALLLLPVVARCGLVPKGVPLWHLALVVCGAGLPFGLVAMIGTQFAPTTHMGVLMAGASPLIAAGFAWMLFNERPDRARGLGLSLMLVGVLLLSVRSLSNWSSDTWRGDLLFLLAAAFWACFTLSFRRSGLTPWQAAGLVNVWSALLVALWFAASGSSNLWSAPAADIAWQALWQGVLAGVLGLWTYSIAIARLGAPNAAAFGALAPAVSALGGWLWLGDPLTSLDGIAVFAAVCGVLLASGAIRCSSSR